jgi:type III restriction enzyme
MTSQNAGTVIDGNPIINFPFSEPSKHWDFGGLVPKTIDGRRTSGYLAPSPDGQLRITDTVIPLTLVNTLRDKTRAWRNEGYPGATSTTKKLFEHWFNDDRLADNTRPFFCQQEAVETIAFLVEARSDLRQGIEVPASGEAYIRWAVKMATGTGKTMVMALLIAWTGLNRIANRSDARFTDQILVVAPNLTVKDRLSGDGGLDPKHPESLYTEFDLIPRHLSSALGQIQVQVSNWHMLGPREEAARSVVKKGPESDRAFTRRVLTGLTGSGKIMVLNDEAHHAYRFPDGLKGTKADLEELREATIWIDGLAKIDRARGVVRTVDVSATPMYPGAFKEKAWTPFEWIVSDFALVDAIESGLVKIPRTPTRDDTGEAIPKYRNLWEHIRKSLPKRTESDDDSHPLTDYLSEADGPLKQLASAWEQTFKAWKTEGRKTPPVMVVIAHDTSVARLLEKHIAEMGEASPLLVNEPGKPKVTIRIDSDALAVEENSSKGGSDETRAIVSSVGKIGKPGEQVRALVSVAMLSEGWDARTVTQILGLRAFSSQLLCEQVVGRGLRRSNMNDLSQPEFVDVYGVPFQLLPMAKATGAPPSTPPDYTNVHSVQNRKDLRIEFPRIIQVVPDIQDSMDIDMSAIEPIAVKRVNDPTETFVAFDLGGSGDGMGGEVQDREVAYQYFRRQKLLFRVAAQLVKPYDRPWLFPQALKIADKVIRPIEEGGKIAYEKGVDHREICTRRYLTVIQERIGAALRTGESEERFLPALDEYQPIDSTDFRNFNSPTDKCVTTEKSHLSHAMCDSGLERKICAVLEKSPEVFSWVKNHKLYLEIPYQYFGNIYRYRPDFIVKLKSGKTLLIEGKGVATEQDDSKTTAARRWIQAVNNWGQLGEWDYEIIFDANDLLEILEAHSKPLEIHAS